MDQPAPTAERAVRLCAKLQTFGASLEPEERDDLARLLALAVAAAQSEEVGGYLITSLVPNTAAQPLANVMGGYAGFTR